MSKTKPEDAQYQILSGFHEEVGEPVPPRNKRRKHFFQPGQEDKLVAEVSAKRLGELVESGVLRKLDGKGAPAAKSGGGEQAQP